MNRVLVYLYFNETKSINSNGYLVCKGHQYIHLSETEYKRLVEELPDYYYFTLGKVNDNWIKVKVDIGLLQNVEMTPEIALLATTHNIYHSILLEKERDDSSSTDSSQS